MEITESFTSFDDSDLLGIHALIIAAYGASEKELRGDGYVRIQEKDFLRSIHEDRWLAIREENKWLACLHYYPLKDRIWGFSLLATDPNETGKGLASSLLNHLETHLKAKQVQSIQIEVLKPKFIRVATKEKLVDWYVKRGYRYAESKSFYEIKDKKYTAPIIEAVFDIFIKQL